VMPKGVEHGQQLTTCTHAGRPRNSVMPKGVEHSVMYAGKFCPDSAKLRDAERR